MDQGQAQKPNQQFIASVNYNKDYYQMNESKKDTNKVGQNLPTLLQLTDYYYH